MKNIKFSFKVLFNNKFLAPSLLLLAIVFLHIAPAYAVKIIPPRLVISPDTKVEHMYIKNNSNKQEVYRFGWKHIGMNKEGEIINLDKFGRDKAPGYKAASEIIRFSPRRAVLNPGETQRVTFMIRRSPDLEHGEYRSHFHVQREPTPKSQSDQAQEAPTTLSESTVQIDVLVSRSVPIYLLHGETNASLELLDAELKKNTEKQKPHQPDHFVLFDVKKTGNRSVIGRSDVYCTIAGEDVKISKPSKAFAVYAEGEFRREQMAVEIPQGGCPNMKIVIKGHHNDVLAGQILGERIVRQ